MVYVRNLSRGIAYGILGLLLLSTPSKIALAQGNPCATKAVKARQNPCAVKNPCSAKNPCAANPCGPGASGGAGMGKAVTAVGTISKVDAGAKKIVLIRGSGQLDLAVGPHALIREGAKVKSLKDLKPGEKVTVSYVDTGRERTIWYVYTGSAAMTNPCGGGNPCAAKNPCSAKNPCAANPCAVKGKQAAKNPCAPKAAKSR